MIKPKKKVCTQNPFLVAVWFLSVPPILASLLFVASENKRQQSVLDCAIPKSPAVEMCRFGGNQVFATLFFPKNNNSFLIENKLCSSGMLKLCSLGML